MSAPSQPAASNGPGQSNGVGRTAGRDDGGTDHTLFFDASPFATLLFTPDLVMIDSNAAHARMSGVPSDEVRGRPIFEVFPVNPDAVRDGAPDTEAVMRASVARAMASRATDEAPIQRHDLPRHDGTFETRYWRMIHSPVFERGGGADAPIVAIRQDAWDVTEAVRLTDRQNAMQRIAGTIAGVAFWEHDVRAGTIVRTSELDEIFGFPPRTPDASDGSAVGGATSLAPFMERVHPDDAERLAETTQEMIAAGAGAVRQMEYRVTRPDGKVRRVAVRGEMGWGEHGQPVIVGTSLDVTELHANEARLERLLAEKEVLLGEVNHRVKNSLQLVSSILSLEARSAAEGERARLRSAAARVAAVSAVHASLYHDDDVRSVEFGAHLREFCARLADSLGAERRGIAFGVTVEPAILRAEVAVPLSLIVNELVANAFKYAHADEAPAGARVDVTFEKRDGNRLALTVSDNGRGMNPGHAFPPSLNHDKSLAERTGLGGRLVSTLARQIDATIATEQDEGWRTTIEFGA